MNAVTKNARVTERVHHCKIHGFKSQASWYQLIGICHCVHVVCKAETDGYHEHQIRFGDDAWSRAVITDELHSWMDAGSTYVQIQRGKSDYRAGADLVLAEVWREVADEFEVGELGGDVPAFPCLLTT